MRHGPQKGKTEVHAEPRSSCRFNQRRNARGALAFAVRGRSASERATRRPSRWGCRRGGCLPDANLLGGTARAKIHRGEVVAHLVGPTVTPGGVAQAKIAEVVGAQHLIAPLSRMAHM